MYNRDGRQKKASTMIHVLSDHFDSSLRDMTLLNVGGSAGIIDEYLSRHFAHVTGIDIDEKAIRYAQANFRKENLRLELGDALDLKYPDDSFDVVICSQVYEHVADANLLMAEMFRVVRPGGVVYFAAGNRIMVNEPHYKLPFLSVLPRPLSHLYMRLAGKGDFYYERHLTYWGLKKLVAKFELLDYTPKILTDPATYDADYMVRPGTLKHKVAAFLSRNLIWLVPGYIWLLKKPG